jgi:hypothetical protein
MAARKKTKEDKGSRQPAGVWNRGRGHGPANPIRVRAKRLDEVEGDKLALAYWLLAKQLVRNDSDQRRLDEHEVRRVAAQIDDAADREASIDRPASRKRRRA